MVVGTATIVEVAQRQCDGSHIGESFEPAMGACSGMLGTLIAETSPWAVWVPKGGRFCASSKRVDTCRDASCINRFPMGGAACRRKFPDRLASASGVPVAQRDAEQILTAARYCGGGGRGARKRGYALSG